MTEFVSTQEYAEFIRDLKHFGDKIVLIDYNETDNTWYVKVQYAKGNIVGHIYSMEL